MSAVCTHPLNILGYEIFKECEVYLYEKMLDKVTATEGSLKESIFENNRAESLLIEFNNEVIGYIIYVFL